MNIAFFWHNKSAYIYIFISILITLYAAQAEERALPPHAATHSIAIKDAVAMALDRNRGLRIADQRREQAFAGADAATGRLLPRVIAVYAPSRTDSPINVFGDKLLQKRFSATDFAITNLNNPSAVNNYHTDVSVVLPVYQGGALWAGKRASEANAMSARWNYISERQTTILTVIQAFAQLKELRAERQAAEKALAAARDHLTDTEALKRRGLAIVSDVMDAKSHMLEAGVALESASHAVASAQDRLRRLLGLPADAAIATRGPVKLTLPDQNRETWVKSADAHHPALHAEKHQLDAARSRADAAMAPFLPAVNLQATEEWNSNTVTPKNSNFTIGAEIRFNVFSGGSDKARLHAAQAATIAKELELEDAKQAVHNHVLEAWRNLKEARNRLAASKQVLQQSLESLRIRKLREQQGLERSSDVLDAQSRADQARARAIRARYALVVAKAQLLAAAGQLNPEVIQ